MLTLADGKRIDQNFFAGIFCIWQSEIQSEILMCKKSRAV